MESWCPRRAQLLGALATPTRSGPPALRHTGTCSSDEVAPACDGGRSRQLCKHADPFHRGGLARRRQCLSPQESQREHAMRYADFLSTVEQVGGLAREDAERAIEA